MSQRLSRHSYKKDAGFNPHLKEFFTKLHVVPCKIINDFYQFRTDAPTFVFCNTSITLISAGITGNVLGTLKIPNSVLHSVGKMLIYFRNPLKTPNFALRSVGKMFIYLASRNL
jgi:hypothetical protein